MITVWRIMNYNKMCYHNQVFATRVQATKKLPEIVNEIMAQYHLDKRKAFKTMSMSEVIETGIFWNKEFGILLAVTHQCLEQEKYDIIEQDVTDVWCSDFESLKDGARYEIMLDCGHQTLGRYDATYGMFVNEDSYCLIEEVNKVKECSLPLDKSGEYSSESLIKEENFFENTC